MLAGKNKLFAVTFLIAYVSAEVAWGEVTRDPILAANHTDVKSSCIVCLYNGHHFCKDSSDSTKSQCVSRVQKTKANEDPDKKPKKLNEWEDGKCGTTLIKYLSECTEDYSPNNDLQWKQTATGEMQAMTSDAALNVLVGDNDRDAIAKVATWSNTAACGSELEIVINQDQITTNDGAPAYGD